MCVIWFFFYNNKWNSLMTASAECCFCYPLFLEENSSDFLVPLYKHDCNLKYSWSYDSWLQRSVCFFFFPSFWFRALNLPFVLWHFMWIMGCRLGDMRVLVTVSPEKLPHWFLCHFIQSPKRCCRRRHRLEEFVFIGLQVTWNHNGKPKVTCATTFEPTRHTSSTCLGQYF